MVLVPVDSSVIITTHSTMMSAKQLAEKACTFLSSSTDPYHAVQNSIAILEAAGFQRIIPYTNSGLIEPAPTASTTTTATTSNSLINPGGKYYYTVQSSTLVAFAVGGKVNAPSNFGFHIIGGHTDSPNLRIKPKSQKVPKKAQTTQLSVECYGGGLWHTWFDRDLSISGKVLIRSLDNDPATAVTTTTTTSSNKIIQKLIQLKEPIARVSTLCIHLQTPAEREAFKVNKEDHTSPIIASTDCSSINNEKGMIESSILEQITNSNDPWLQGQEPMLLHKIATELNINITQIADYDLSLYDIQSSTMGGIQQEYIYSGRLDNLATVFNAVTALSMYDVTESTDVSMIVCFDHEEVGSVSSNGAGSPVLQEAVQYVSSSLGNTSSIEHLSTIQKSFCLSIDQAHAVHPNYMNKHDPVHSPFMNGGIVVKSNANQRYATNSLTGFVIRELGRICNVPIQEFAGTYFFLTLLCQYIQSNVIHHIFSQNGFGNVLFLCPNNHFCHSPE
jgi:aspartyl aminopeptidase